MKDLVLRPRRFSLYLGLCCISLVAAFGHPAFILLIPLWGYHAYQAYKNGSYSFAQLNMAEPPQYNMSEYGQLVRSFHGITSFKEVGKWDEQAKAECERMHAFNGLIEAYLSQVKSQISERQYEVAKLEFFDRIFHYHTMERLLEEVYAFAKSRSISTSIDDLEESIKFSPNDKEEQRQMLIKMNETKDEMSSEKRMITEQMRDVRAAAKLKNAQVDNSFFSSAQSKRIQKQENRLEKENALANLESRKTRLQQRIEELDKKITWVKRIKEVKESKKNNSYDIEEAS